MKRNIIRKEKHGAHMAKKIIGLLMVLQFCVILCACGNDGNDGKDDDVRRTTSAHKKTEAVTNDGNADRDGDNGKHDTDAPTQIGFEYRIYVNDMGNPSKCANITINENGSVQIQLPGFGGGSEDTYAGYASTADMGAWTNVQTYRMEESEVVGKACFKMTDSKLMVTYIIGSRDDDERTAEYRRED